MSPRSVRPTFNNTTTSLLHGVGAMNNDPLPSSAAGDQSSTTATNTTPEQDGISAAESDRLRKAGLAKKLQFMTHLMKSLDMVVFAEICTLYYMELVYRSSPPSLSCLISNKLFLTDVPSPASSSV